MKIAESDVTVYGAINGDAPLRSEYAPGLDKTPHFESRNYRHDSPIRHNPLGSPIIDSGEPFYLPATRSGILQGQAVIASSLVARSTAIILRILSVDINSGKPELMFSL